MKKIVNLFLMMVVFAAACSCNTNNPDPTKVKLSKSFDIVFDANNIEDIIYDTEDEYIVIEYNDDDIFDYENLAFMTGRDEWYGDYVCIYVHDSVAAQFLADYNATFDVENDKASDVLNDKYYIVEHDIIYEDNARDIVFELKIGVIED